MVFQCLKIDGASFGDSQHVPLNLCQVSFSSYFFPRLNRFTPNSPLLRYRPLLRRPKFNAGPINAGPNNSGSKKLDDVEALLFHL